MNFAREELDVNSRFALREEAAAAATVDPLVRRKAGGGRDRR